MDEDDRKKKGGDEEHMAKGRLGGRRYFLEIVHG